MRGSGSILLLYFSLEVWGVTGCLYIPGVRERLTDPVSGSPREHPAKGAPWLLLATRRCFARSKKIRACGAPLEIAALWAARLDFLSGLRNRDPNRLRIS